VPPKKSDKTDFLGFWEQICRRQTSVFTWKRCFTKTVKNQAQTKGFQKTAKLAGFLAQGLPKKNRIPRSRQTEILSHEVPA